MSNGGAVVSVPVRSITTIIHWKRNAFSVRCFLRVVVEGKGAVGSDIACIGLTQRRICEIAVGGVGHCDTSITGIIRDGTHQVRTISKHVGRIAYNALTPICTAVDSLKLRTPIEHAAHVRHFFRIERRHIKFGQLSASLEHATHVCHIFCMKVFKVVYN